MSYPLRLPSNLEAIARERAAGIGISFNAFLCVCVDAYVNGAAKPAIEAGAPRAASQSEQRRAGRDEAEFLAVERDAFGDDAGGDETANWQFFHPDPDYWPYIDPDGQWSNRRDEIVKKYGETEAGNEALEREYWATRERPAFEQPGPAPQRKRRAKRAGPG